MAAKTVSTNPEWKHLVNSYFDDVYLRYNPTAGTSAGLHQYDAKLEDYSHSSLDAQAAALHQYEKKIVAFPTSSLGQPDQGDREFLLGNIRSQPAHSGNDSAMAEESGYNSRAGSAIPLLSSR